MVLYENKNVCAFAAGQPESNIATPRASPCCCSTKEREKREKEESEVTFFHIKVRTYMYMYAQANTQSVKEPKDNTSLLL